MGLLTHPYFPRHLEFALLHLLPKAQVGMQLEGKWIAKPKDAQLAVAYRDLDGDGHDADDCDDFDARRAPGLKEVSDASNLDEDCNSATQSAPLPATQPAPLPATSAAQSSTAASAPAPSPAGAPAAPVSLAAQPAAPAPAPEKPAAKDPLEDLFAPEL